MGHPEGPIRKMLREKGITKTSPEIRGNEFGKLMDVMDRFGDYLAGQSETNCAFIAAELGARFGLSSDQIIQMRERCIQKSRRR